jgi:hypothetical protein
MLVLAALLGCVLALRMAWPSNRVFTIEFRTTFDGLERDAYPNGVPFGGEEFIAEPVLRDVYTKQGADRFGPFDAFRNAFAVARDNPQLSRVHAEYATRLADQRLSPVERSSVEAQYRQLLASAAGQTRFRLMWRDPAGLERPSSEQVRALLHDVLGTWQYLAREHKKATSYDVAVLSKNVLQTTIMEAEDYIVALDVMRAKVDRFLAVVDRLMRIPGAGSVRGGSRLLSLAEIKAKLQDMQRYEIVPLFVLARGNGLVRDPRRLEMFLESRRRQARLDIVEAEARVAHLQRAFLDYSNQGWQPAEEPGAPASGPQGEPQRQPAQPTGDDVTAVIPQFGDTFFTRLAETASTSSDVLYRQKLTDRLMAEQDRVVEIRREEAYYAELEKSLANVRVATEGQGPLEAFKRRFDRTLAELRTTIDDINELYADLSKRNLDPLPNLYAITRDVGVATESPLVTWRLVLLSLLGAGGVYVGLTLLGRWSRPHAD